MVSIKLNLIGKIFERLTVVAEAGSNKHRNLLWKCECSCGETVIVLGSNLKRGHTQSCGCLQRERSTSHGLRSHSLYTVWVDMKRRCFNTRCKHYSNYGGRGITIYDGWITSFENFYNDVLESYEEGLHLDRIDNDGNYEPNNVRWVTQQQNNCNKGSNKGVSSKYKGVSWDKGRKKWMAKITKDKKSYYLGYFTDEVNAAKTYNEAAKELFGEYAYLNKFEGFLE